ncbi:MULTISPECIES: hypothetical protein [Pseudomonas]|uniref:Uncharacterized protein n=1 Tax=Pseudomonas umsongensis TaxID=198618 RepID=A0ACC5M6Z1_9PSED|nr:MULTISPECIES: hypothetical protein [Pseudomonas]MBB2884436.1 hypothetical protein [Pseudomonas umsongensis]NMN77026.1 hypothetical protein [Pseudomonas sp. KD5]
MQVQVITGDGRDGSTNMLKHLMELRDWISKPATVYAEAYGATGLVETLKVRAANEKEILVLDCSREQIQALLQWQSATDDMIELEDLVLHLVRRVSSSGTLQNEGGRRE